MFFRYILRACHRHGLAYERIRVSMSETQHVQQSQKFSHVLFIIIAISLHQIRSWKLNERSLAFRYCYISKFDLSVKINFDIDDF